MEIKGYQNSLRTMQTPNYWLSREYETRGAKKFSKESGKKKYFERGIPKRGLKVKGIRPLRTVLFICMNFMWMSDENLGLIFILETYF